MSRNKLYEVLPKSSRNSNAARKLLVVQLCAARYRELCSLWIILPSGVLLWGGLFFFFAFLWHRISAVLRSHRPATMTDANDQRICVKFCFKATAGKFREFLGSTTYAVGRAVAYWLWHYATNRQVAGSIPDGVIGIFQWHNPSGCTMALGSTQPLTEMSTRCISWE